jgi:hypothetical protein
LVDWVKIRTTAVTHFDYRNANGSSLAYLAGSSLAGQALSWKRISQVSDREIIGWGIAGGSPCEWEMFQPRARGARMTFIVVSSYDLDEAILCDFRAEVVPIGHTIQALRQSHADWSHSRTALSQYPTAWLRLLFPALGRSRGIMGELHQKLEGAVGHSTTIRSDAGPTLSLGQDGAVDEARNGRISDWPEAERLRKLTAMSSGFQGSHSFQGPKHFALRRMLQYGKNRGDVIATVVPVSPTYAKAFMNMELSRQFESSIGEIERDISGIRWIRLDHLNALNSDDNFYDLVHMNAVGQQITTDTFLSLLKGSGHQ